MLDACTMKIALHDTCPKCLPHTHRWTPGRQGSEPRVTYRDVKSFLYDLANIEFPRMQLQYKLREDCPLCCSNFTRSFLLFQKMHHSHRHLWSRCSGFRGTSACFLEPFRHAQYLLLLYMLLYYKLLSFYFSFLSCLGHYTGITSSPPHDSRLTQDPGPQQPPALYYINMDMDRWHYL